MLPTQYQGGKSMPISPLVLLPEDQRCHSEKGNGRKPTGPHVHVRCAIGCAHWTICPPPLGNYFPSYVGCHSTCATVALPHPPIPFTAVITCCRQCCLSWTIPGLSATHWPGNLGAGTVSLSKIEFGLPYGLWYVRLVKFRLWCWPWGILSWYGIIHRRNSLGFYG